MVEPQRLLSSFQQLYGKAPRLFSAPGRINLIGEHTDYNEGFVLPMAANLRTYVAAAPRDDSVIRVHSFDLAEDSEFDFKASARASPKDWISYIEGITRVFVEKGCKLRGADIAISSEVPIGAGLSSSAALEICVGFALLKLAESEIDLLDLALSAQVAEHKFVGTMSGVMDQLTSALAVRNHAMLIDCRSLERELTPVNIPSMSIVICDTQVKHDLATSAYNERRHECEQAVKILSEQKPDIRSLRDVTIADFQEYRNLLPEILRRRCRHVVSENERTLTAAQALKNGHVQRLGELITLSHKSLRDDYEVSCRELNIMFELATAQPSVAGARMMGGGFGGCTVNLVSSDGFHQFCQTVSAGYQRATGVVPTILTVVADDGVCEVN